MGYGFEDYGEFIASTDVSIIQRGSNVQISIAGQARLTIVNATVESLDEDNFYFG